MRSLGRLIKRDCLVFIRDKGAVFFSLLSMLIVLLLMVVFLGEMNVGNITDVLNEYGGVRDTKLDHDHALQLIQLWTMAGILVVNSVTVTLTVVGTMVKDREKHRLESFYTTPVSKAKVAVGYIASAIIIGALLCLITFIVGQIYIVCTGGEMLSILTWMKVIGLVLLNVCVFSIIMYLVAIFVSTTSGWSGLATIVGTLVGFVGAIYLPMALLPDGVATALKYFPILHGAALMREVLCKEAITTTFVNMPKEAVSAFREEMGIDIILNKKIVPTGCEFMFVAGCGIIFLVIVFILLHRQKCNDR